MSSILQFPAPLLHMQRFTWLRCCRCFCYFYLSAVVRRLHFFLGVSSSLSFFPLNAWFGLGASHKIRAKTTAAHANNLANISLARVLAWLLWTFFFGDFLSEHKTFLLLDVITQFSDREYRATVLNNPGIHRSLVLSRSFSETAARLFFSAGLFSLVDSEINLRIRGSRTIGRRFGEKPKSTSSHKLLKREPHRLHKRRTLTRSLDATSNETSPRLTTKTTRTYSPQHKSRKHKFTHFYSLAQKKRNK